MTVKRLSGGVQPGNKDKRLARTMEQLAKVDRAKLVLDDELRKLAEILTTGTTSTLGIWHEWIRLWESHRVEVYSRHERGKDLGIIGRLLKSNTPEKLHVKFGLYFRSDERWVRDSGWSLAVFEKVFNGLGVRRATDAVTRNALATRRTLQDEGLFGGKKK